MNRLPLFLVFVVTLLAHPGHSQEYVFDHLNIDQGLSNSSVTCIYQDHQGFMWFGTFNGLNKYDGYEITTYVSNPANPLSLSDNAITCIYEDSHHNLWIGTNLGGINLYNRETDSFTRYTQEAKAPYQLTSNRIQTILEDSRGQLWVGSNRGLNIFNHQTKAFQLLYHQASDSTSINSDQIYSIIENEKGEVLILTNEKAVNRFNPQSRNFSHFPIPDNQSPFLKTARILFQDKQKDYWIATLDAGLMKFSGSQFQYYEHTPTKPNSLGHNQVRSIIQSREGKLWVGTDGGGVNLLDKASGQFTHLKANEEQKGSLSSNAVYCIYEDRAGTIWVGTFGGGVNFYSKHKAKFAHYTNIPHISNSLSHRSVLALFQDSQGKTWIGTDGGGLDLFDPVTKTFEHFRNDPNNSFSLSSDVVKTIYEDKSGNLWVGTYLGGLNRYDRASHRFIRYQNDPTNPESITNNIVWYLYEDHHNQLWVSTLGGGLCIMNREKGTFTRFQPFSGPGSLGDYNIVSILEDRQGNLWIGTEDHGLNLYDYQTHTFTYLRNDPKDELSLSSNRIQALYEDSRGDFWVGTAGGGLNLMDRQKRKFRRFTTQHGLPSNVVNGILEDKEGKLWISTNRGVCKFDVRSKTFKNFDHADGLQSNEFNINAAMAARNGDLYFGGINGFNVFAPADLMSNPTKPPVVFTDFQIFNKPVKIGAQEAILSKHISQIQDITLSYKEAVVTFKFAALNFISPEKNQYAYKLEGFDSDWRYLGTKREATYTNLDPGDYVFKVKAANNDGLWNQQGAFIHLTVTPPWWRTIWFRTLVVMAVLGSAISFFQFRTQSIRKKLRLEKLRELRIKEAEMREIQLKHEKKVVEMSKTQLETEMLHKNSELATSVMSIVHQNETLFTIKDSIKEAIDETDTVQQRKKMLRVMRVIEREIKPEQHWHQFEELFNQLHENFLQRLKETYPQLTSRDIKICAYLRMNLNSKEIAPLIGLSVRGVEDMRYRVRKKMELDTSINLADFILSM